MRGLSDEFFNCLKSGFLSGIIESVKGDSDLDLEIRDSYINVYYKGNSLLNVNIVQSGQESWKNAKNECRSMVDFWTVMTKSVSL